MVFRGTATQSTLQLPAPKETAIGRLDEALNLDWKVSFEQGNGAPDRVDFQHLVSWTEMPLPTSDDGIKYFSGTATYSKSIDIPADDLTKGAQLWLKTWRRA
ncbi:MAG: glycosylhydrolase-like jelly roll fold domain-containing protein [Terracidiphilus sp.]